MGVPEPRPREAFHLFRDSSLASAQGDEKEGLVNECLGGFCECG